jgi:Uma2 family endonuclease
MTVIENSRILTPEQYLNLPDSVGFELVDGHLVERHVSRDSALVAMEIGALLVAANKQSGRAAEVYTSELSYRCFAGDPDMHRRADVSVVRRSRLAGVPHAVGMMPIPADLVVEVLSPNDLAYDVSRKVKLYLGNGFATVWVVDPEARTVAIYTADAPGRVLRAGDQIDAGDPLPTLRCRVADFFAGLDDPID